MSFLVKSILGQNVVHPRQQSSDNHTASQLPDSRQQSEPDAHLGTPTREVNRVPTRTLLLRVQSCTIAQDRRDALRELQNSNDLPYVMAANEVVYLCSMLRNSPDDEEIVDASLAILSGITDLGGYPSGSTLYSVSEKEKLRIRDSFLHELVAEVPLFLGYMREGAFWKRFHSVQILQRLQDYDPPTVHKLLLSSHGVGVLVDILNDSSHGGALRNEGLVLITAITATDTELQTLLAFDNAFETLFSVINEEGGLDGGVIVSDCLTIVHNMLRNNKATQKLFREMGCPKYLGPLMDAVLARVRSAAHDHFIKMGSVPFAAAPAESGGTTNLFTPLTSGQSVIVVMTVSILNCVLREAETHHDVSAAQETLLECGVLAPLAGIALSGAAVNDAARVEAMRALALLLHANPNGIEKFLEIQVPTLLSVSPPLRMEEWSALRAILHVLFDIEDRVTQLSAAKVLDTLLSLNMCEESVLQELVKGLELPGRNAAVVQTLSSKPMTMTSSEECGAALAKTLFGGLQIVRGEGQYYAALLLDRLVSIPRFADQLLNIQPCDSTASKGLPGKPVLVQKESTAVMNMTSKAESVFTAFVQYIVRCICGHGEIDLNTLSACFRCLFRWMRTSRRAVLIFLTDKSFYKIFNQRVTQEDGPPHVRFWSAILCAALCVLAPSEVNLPEEVEDNARTSVMDKQKLLELFINDFGGVSIFETILFDVKASSPAWSDPPTSAFLNSAPVMYDIEMKNMLLEIIQDFKDICPSRSVNTPGGTLPKHPESDTLAATSRIGICAVVPPVTDRLETIIGSQQYANELNELVESEDCVSSNLASFSAKVLDIKTPSFSSSLQERNRIELASPAVPPLLEDEPGHVKEHQMDAKADAYETQMLALKERNSELERELELYRQKERHNADALLDQAQREKQQTSREAELQETIQLLEETLAAKDDEHEVLVQSLNMLDGQLRAALANAEHAKSNPPPNTSAVANGETEELRSVRSSLLKMTQERDELLLLLGELHGDRPLGMPDRAHEFMSLPPAPPSHAPSAESRGSGRASLSHTQNFLFAEMQNSGVFARQHAPHPDKATTLGMPLSFGVKNPAVTSPLPHLPDENTDDEYPPLQRHSATPVGSTEQCLSHPNEAMSKNLYFNTSNDEVGSDERGISFDSREKEKDGVKPVTHLPDKSISSERECEEQQRKQRQDFSQQAVSHNPFLNMTGPDDDGSGVLF